MTEDKQPGEQGKGMRGWVNCKDEKPAQEKECFFDCGEIPPAWGRFRTIGKFDYVVVMESSGEEELYPYSDYERWLDETSAKGDEDQEALLAAALRIVDTIYRDHRSVIKQMDVSNDDKRIVLNHLGISSDNYETH